MNWIARAALLTAEQKTREERRRVRQARRFVEGGCLLCGKVRTTHDVCRTCRTGGANPVAVALLSDPRNAAAARAAQRLGGRRALESWLDAHRTGP